MGSHIRLASHKRHRVTDHRVLDCMFNGGGGGGGGIHRWQGSARWTAPSKGQQYGMPFEYKQWID